MGLKIIALVSIFLGGFTGFYFSDLETKEKKAENFVADICKHKYDKKDVFESASEKRCVTRIANKGEDFYLKPHEAQQRVQDIFIRRLEAQKIRPEDFNIYTSKTASGKVRRYDPRLDIFRRFAVNSFVKSNESIEDYSIYLKNVQSVESAMKSLKCTKPKLSKIKTMDGLKVFENYRKLSAGANDNKFSRKKKAFIREDFSAFQELEKKVGWYMYFVYNQNNITNFLLANHCNQSISLVLNHCVIDPAYDMQFEELYWFEQKQAMGINIYCKKSHQSEWTLLKTKTLRKNDL